MIAPSDMLVLINLIGTAYPKFTTFSEIDQAKNTAKVWAGMLSDLDIDLVTVAIKKHIATSKWAPSIAEIRESALSIMQPDILTAAEGWGEVTKLISRYGSLRYNPAAKLHEALDTLSPTTRKVVEQIGYSAICEAEEMGVVRGQFMRMYEQVANRQRQEALLPEGVKQKMQELAAGNRGVKMIENTK